MSTPRRRRSDDGSGRSIEGEGRRSRGSALRKSRQQQKTRTTITVLVMAVLCVPLALWIYPKITSGTVLSRLAGAQMTLRTQTASQITGVRRTHETLEDGTFSVHVSCEVYNGTTKTVSGVVVTLSALDDDGEILVEQVAEPTGFALDGRDSRAVEVSLTGLTRQQIGRIASLRLAADFDSPPPK